MDLNNESLMIIQIRGKQQTPDFDTVTLQKNIVSFSKSLKNHLFIIHPTFGKIGKPYNSNKKLACSRKLFYLSNRSKEKN